MRAIYLFLLASLVVLSSCTGLPQVGGVEAPNEHLSPLSLDNSPLPPPTQVSAPLPATPVGAVLPTPTAVVVPTQDANMAAIEGAIVIAGRARGDFPALLVLGDPTGSQPVGAYVAIDVESSPKGYVRPDGSFTFPNVQPGVYSIVVWTPNGVYLAPDPATGNTWVIEIEGDTIFRTGLIQVPALPDS